MKTSTATLLLTLSSLFATYGYCQAAGEYAGAAAAASGSTSGSASALGHSLNNAMSGSAAGTANATSNSTRVSGTASGASSTTTHIANTSAAATQSGQLSAELTQKLNSKNARVGDEVFARTTSTAQLSNGTKLPKGTRLIGKVTEVQARSDAQHDGHLAFAFNRAVLHDGTEVPIHASLRSIAAPFAVYGMEQSSDDDVAFAEPVGASAGARAGGGLLGGGAIARTSGLVGGATSTAVSAPAHITNAAAATVHDTTNLAGQAGVTAATVTNLPGVHASSSANSTTILDARGKNVDLNSGTQLTFAVAAQ